MQIPLLQQITVKKKAMGGLGQRCGFAAALPQSFCFYAACPPVNKEGIMNFLKSFRIKTKIMVLFLAIMLLSTFLPVSVTYYNNQKRLKEQIGELSAQTLYALDNSMALMTEHVEQDANVLFWNQIVQDTLGNIEAGSQNPEIRAQVKDCLINMMLAGDYISSIILYDHFGNAYHCVREGVLIRTDLPVSQAPWYDLVVASNGDWIFETDGGGMVTYRGEDRNILSMIKVIKSKEDYSDLGILMVNIDEKTIQRYFEIVGNHTDSNFYILSDDALLFGPKDQDSFEDKKQLITELEVEQPLFVKTGKHPTVYQKIYSSIENWVIVGEIPMESFHIRFDNWQTAAILAGNLLLLLTCWVVITMMLSKPIQQMEEQINSAQGLLKDIPVEEGRTDEISSLKHAYNRMLQSIRELLKKTKEEEEIIRQNELDLILEQISPHFLYNTLDTISALALIGDHEKAFQTTQALGRFYRNSLSSGRQMVTVKEELDMIQSYLTILNIRYENQIQLECEAEPEIEEEKILKLTLQPLVENAVCHGIRLKPGAGKLKIVCRSAGSDQMELSVWDDGIGMDKQKIKEVLCQNGKRRGFGLQSVRQRMELFYGKQGLVRLESEAGQWTRVTVYAMRGMDDGNEKQNEDINCR